MGNGFRARASTFRFEGTRFTVFLREQVKKAHDVALADMLRFLTEFTPNFTGETQATFRQFRDYLSAQGLEIKLSDFPNYAKISGYSQTLQARWHTKQKIANLPNAGFTTLAGGESSFKVTITKQGFAITVDFKSGSDAFAANPELYGIFEEARKIYRQSFKDGLTLLFEPNDFAKHLKSFFNRVDIRS